MATWERHQLTSGPILPSGQRMIFYVMRPAGWTPTGKYRCLVWEHADGQGNRAYRGDDSLPQAGQGDQWFNNAAFQSAYPGLILLPACDQTTASSSIENFGGWTPPNDDANEDSVALCAQYAVANLGADPDKIIVGGNSLGGIGSWALALDHNRYNGTRSKTFCAFVPMAGVIERNGFGVGPTAAQFATITGVPIFAVHGAGDTTSQPNWDLAVWKQFAGANTPTVSAPGAQAGTSKFRLLFDPNKGHDVWDTYVPLPGGKPIWDWAWAQSASGTGVTPPVAESPDNTVVKFGTGASIIDSQNNTWTITANAQIAQNGLIDGTTKSVTQIAYEKKILWQQNQAGLWYAWQNPGWSAGTTASPIPGDLPPPPGPNPTPAGFFKVSGGKILRPDSSVFIGGGINFNQDQMATVCTGADCKPLLTLFPNTRIVRIANRTFADPSTYASFITAMTAKQILMDFEDHTSISGPIPTGAALAAELKWYAAMAAAYKDNPYVAFGTLNEPGNGTNLPNIAAHERLIYDAIRGTGSHALLFLQLPSGGNKGLVGINGRGYDGSAPMTASLFATMYNVLWDMHFYGFIVKGSTDIPTIKGMFLGSVAQAYGVAAAQSITSADGLVPVVIGEFGNSTDGNVIDPNGTQICDVVGNSGLSFMAWAWRASNNIGDLLTVNTTTLTPYGQQIAGLVNAVALANPIGPPGPPPPPPPPPPGVTVASVQAEIDAITASLQGSQTALAKIRADVALLP